MKETANKKKINGVVVSTKMTGTVKVDMEYQIRHPRYKKTIKRKKTILAHADTEVKEGDKVVIVETKPYSKNVNWKVVK
jgi:small subunit ribosomal protein S17